MKLEIVPVGVRSLPFLYFQRAFYFCSIVHILSWYVTDFPVPRIVYRRYTHCVIYKITELYTCCPYHTYTLVCVGSFFLLIVIFIKKFRKKAALSRAYNIYSGRICIIEQIKTKAKKFILKRRQQVKFFFSCFYIFLIFGCVLNVVIFKY